MPARFKSEYSKNYQSLAAKRPVTLKARDPKDFRTMSPPLSSHRAGLMSNQTVLAQEPPLQRKKIVPYANNHNIFQTCTVKEMTDRQWLNDESASSVSSVDNHITRDNKNKKRTMYEKEFGWKTAEMTSPIINAEQRFASMRPQSSYPYVRDGIPRKTEYTTNYKKKTQSGKNVKKRETSTKKRTSSAASPEKLPPAGMPTHLSTNEDKRLLKPSDDGEYTRFKYGDPRRTVPTEYQSKYRQESKPARRNSWHGEDLDVFNQIIERRNEAYFLASRNRGAHFSRENLESMYRENAQREMRSTASELKESHKKHQKSKSVPKPKQLYLQSYKNDYSPDKYSETSSIYSDVIPPEEEVGRSPTPELIEHGQSRRHHYDLTTPAVGGALLTTPFIPPQTKTVPYKDNQKKPTSRHIDGLSQVSPRHSDAHSSSTRSLYNESVYSENGHDRRSRGSEKPVRRSVGTSTRNEDVMSEASMSSRASVASETLERAKNRRNVWKQ